MPSTWESQKTTLQFLPCHKGYRNTSGSGIVEMDNQSSPHQSKGAPFTPKFGECWSSDSPNSIISLGTSTWASETRGKRCCGSDIEPRPRFSPHVPASL